MQTPILTPELVATVQEHVKNSQTILILLGNQAPFEQVAAAAGLYLTLQELGKEVMLLSPTQPLLEPHQTEGVVGLPDLQTQLGNRDLHVSFAYTPEKVDKVSYHIDETHQTFHLVIKPQRGQRPLEIDKVSMNYAGAEADLVITVGVSDLAALEHLYEGFENLYETTPIISFHLFETMYGAIKIDSSGKNGLSELVAELIQVTQWSLTADAATNLMAGIEEITDGFRSLAMTADTFTTVAVLMRAGARRARRPAAPFTSRAPMPKSLPIVGTPTNTPNQQLVRTVLPNPNTINLTPPPPRALKKKTTSSGAQSQKGSVSKI